MKENEPIVFVKDGITYTYTFSIGEYDGNKVISWYDTDCVWKPKNIKEENK